MKTMRQLCIPLFWVMLVSGSEALVAQEAATGESAAAAEAAAETADVPAEEEAAGFPPEQIEQLVAPVALYPDALLAQVLMASTYPLDIVQAARWSADHADLEGEALQEAVDQEPWDPSVQALVFFPEVLGFMNDNLDWSQDLGEAYLGQEDDVIDAVQRLRAEAKDAGNLESNEQQQVVVEGDTIVVQPAEPEVVYVPSYNPAEVYNQPPPATTYYPSTYTEPSSSSSDNLVSFGLGALAGGLLTAAIMWDDDDDWCCGVYYGGPGRYGRPGYWGRPDYWDGGWRRPVNIDRDVNIKTGDINVNRGNKVGKWEHNPEHRGNINYKNKKTQARYSQELKKGPVNRDVARGYQKDGKRPEPKRDQRAPAETRRPEARDAKTSQKRDVDLKRPDSKQAKAPQKAAAKPQARDTGQRQARAPERKAAPQNKGSGGFKKSDAKMDRAASQRGAKSTNRGGGGGKGRAKRG